MCLASTAEFTAPTSSSWDQLPLSNSITLQPGAYWLAEIDTGAGVIKYCEKPGRSVTVYASASMAALDVGNQLSMPLTSDSSTLAIVACFDAPQIPGASPPLGYAEDSQCWTSASSSSPDLTQTSFQTGQTVYIYWTPQNPSTVVVDISVDYPSGTSPGQAALCSLPN